MPADLAPEHVVLLVGLLVAAATDARWGRIPNALTFPMIVLGIAITAAGPVPWAGVLGAAAAFAIHFPLFAAGVERGGDAKLMMGIGACFGWRGMLEATAWFAVLYLPVGVVILTIRGRLWNLLAALRYTAARAQGLDPGPPPEPTQLRTAPVILVAGVLAWATDLLALAR